MARQPDQPAVSDSGGDPSNAPPPPTPGLVLFRPDDGGDALRVRIEGETVWLTQAQMADLFQTTPQNVTIHLKGIYADGELDERATCKELLQVRLEGDRRVQRSLKHYALDAILAVGYRVRSHRGTQFRQWATATLSEFLVKGFAMDDERLKQGRTLAACWGTPRTFRTHHPSCGLRNPCFRPRMADFALPLIDGGAFCRYSPWTVHPPGAPQGSSLWRVFSCAGGPAWQAA
jgi:hypothetical protein